MKRLLLLRHAKAEQAKKDTHEDRDRVLTGRGRSDAPRIGRVMKLRGYLPDLILCSPSNRTRETLELAAIANGIRAEFPESLYLGSAAQIAVLLRALPNEVHRPLVVGHNPGLEECVTLFTSKWESTTLRSRFHSEKEKFPTCALAVLDFQGAKWTNLGPHSATFADFAMPKDLSRD